MIREDLLIEPLARFFKQRIFGAGRTSHLAALADATEASRPVDLLGRTRSIIAEIDELWARQANLITELETLKPTGDPTSTPHGAPPSRPASPPS